MTVTASDLKTYKSSIITDTLINGGVISSNLVIDNVVNNLFPNITDAERLVGGSRYRKVFTKNENSSDIAALNVARMLTSVSSAADYFQIIAGTDTDTQAEADDYTAWKGAGVLNAGVSAAGTSVVVDYETNSGVANGDTVLIYQIKVNLTGVTGTFQDNEKITESGGAYGYVNNAQASYLIMNANAGIDAADVITGADSAATATVSSIEILSEYLTVSNVSWSSNQGTLTVSQLANDYIAGAIVGSLVAHGDLEPASSGWTETSSAGTYDETTYPLVMFNIGTVNDNWTLTFSDATNFTVSGTTTGSVGSGTTGGDFQPANGASYYFKIASAGFAGTWANGDTIEFTTVHAAKALWFKETWAAAIASSQNIVVISAKAESA